MFFTQQQQSISRNIYYSVHVLPDVRVSQTSWLRSPATGTTKIQQQQKWNKLSTASFVNLECVFVCMDVCTVCENVWIMYACAHGSVVASIVIWGQPGHLKPELVKFDRSNHHKPE